MTIKDTVKKQLALLKDQKLVSNAEIVVLELILFNTRITQRNIAETEKWLGCHPTHEKNVVKNEFETTTRKVRQIVRDIRVKHGLPILADKCGYFVPSSQEEAAEYLTRLERESRSRAASSLETYRVMTKSLSVKSDYFDTLVKMENNEQAD